MGIFWKIHFMLFVMIHRFFHSLVSCSGVEGPLHIIFCMVDHYEPGTGNVSKQIEAQRVDELLCKYPLLVEKHKDSYGNIPRRTWFFPPHYHRNYNLKKLVSLCEKGFGEIELHLHHGKTQPDTSDNLKQTILQCLKEYGEFGVFGSQNGDKKYAFIHGDWALDNSRGGKFCGVNNELQILDSTGCYADFTFPSLCESNPRQINSIFYAIDNPSEPKSYNKGKTVTVGGGKTGDLMIIQGPLYPFFLSRKLSSLRVIGDVVNGIPPVTTRRINSWITTKIHLKGKNNWIFVKTHTHGATDSAAVLNGEMDSIFKCLENNYNDGHRYILHYVTAREMYNIIKAVEAGEATENPESYKDYLVKKPVYDSSKDIACASNILKEMIAKTYN